MEDLPVTGQFITRHHFRYLILVLGTFCISSVFSNVVTMSFTLVCMDPNRYNKTKLEDLTFPLHDYSDQQKAEVQWAISAASMLATLPFSYACTRWGAKYIFFASGIISAVATALIPVAADWGFGWVIIARVFQGFAYACDFAVVGMIATRWAGLSEISIFISMLTLFPAYSNTFTNFLSGFVCASKLGWPWVHYIHGLVCLTLFSLWFIFYTDKPEENRFVSSKELAKIHENKAEGHKKVGKNIPYLKICKNPVIWTIWLNAFVDLFAAFWFIIYGPTYNNYVLKYELKSNGVLGAFEIAGIIPFKLFTGWLSDRYNCVPEREKMWIYNSLCTIIPAVIFVVVCFLPTNVPLLTIILFAISNASVGLNGGGLLAHFFGTLGNLGGYYRCCCLVARQYAEFVLALCQFIKSAVFFLAPLLVNIFVTNYSNANEWHIVFYIMAGFLIIANLIFCYFATDKPANFVLEEEHQELDVERRRSSRKLSGIDYDNNSSSKL